MNTRLINFSTGLLGFRSNCLATKIYLKPLPFKLDMQISAHRPHAACAASVLTGYRWS